MTNPNLRKDEVVLKKVYSDIEFAISEIAPFLSEDELNRRRYHHLTPVLKKYIELLQNDDIEEQSKGFFTKLRNKEDESDRQLASFLRVNSGKLDKIKSCARCKCLNCVKVCDMGSCDRCSPTDTMFVASCDNEKVSVSFVENRFIWFTDNNTGAQEQHAIIAYIQDKEYSQFYVMTEYKGSRFVFYLYSKTTGDEYGVIEDVEDRDFADKAYERALIEV